MDLKKNLYFCLILCLITISICSKVQENVKYESQVTDEIRMRDAVYKFLEVFSLSNKEAITSLKSVASDNVIVKFSSLSGNTETRVPIPTIITYKQLDDKTVEVIFDSNLEDYMTLYRYTFEFDKNSYKIYSVDTEFLYRGVPYEEED